MKFMQCGEMELKLVIECDDKVQNVMIIVVNFKFQTGQRTDFTPVFQHFKEKNTIYDGW